MKSDPGLVFSVFLFLCVLCVCGSFSFAADRPNVLWITCGAPARTWAATATRLQSRRTSTNWRARGSGTRTPSPRWRGASRARRHPRMWAPSVGTHRTSLPGHELPAGVKGYPQVYSQAGLLTNNSKRPITTSPTQRRHGTRTARTPTGGSGPKAKRSSLCLTSQRRTRARIPNPAGRNAATLSAAERHTRPRSRSRHITRMSPKSAAIGLDLRPGHGHGQGGRRHLKQLADDGLADDTSSSSIPTTAPARAQAVALRFEQLACPLTVRFPEKWKRLAPSGPGTTSERLVKLRSFHFGPRFSLCERAGAGDDAR